MGDGRPPVSAGPTVSVESLLVLLEYRQLPVDQLDLLGVLSLHELCLQLTDLERIVFHVSPLSGSGDLPATPHPRAGHTLMRYTFFIDASTSAPRGMMRPIS